MTKKEPQKDQKPNTKDPRPSKIPNPKSKILVVVVVVP